MVPLWQRSLSLMLTLGVIRVARSQWEMHLPVTLTPGRKGAVGHTILNVLWSLSSSSSSVVPLGTLPKFLDQWRSTISSRFSLNMVKGHHLQLRYHPLSFCNFRWFNIKSDLAYHCIIQKK